ncbi:hypothetical protein MCOR29_011033 [Pyricularia oryzae]|uniref:Uncharacterized protein n=1 Tax=Pyricularia oryzae TaxID=318829 RepID=A0A4V1C6G8_PYROR|nr:hypothetical protein MCOR26_008403 [Pyricularia oryzae]KAI6299157.1 hypothetical protein MCOR29_011033 [Pyricularia oryzae]KAI6311131.1 hypothetical protein MCOR34_006123 [Pyricularia oryzae]KAI6417387.1 hypothetical protein MCOR21_011104 [Pyricularia oryzae]KAI6452006.1 hypothetical protein MCOR22_001075 [Pyricularia oryzae]
MVAFGFAPLSIWILYLAATGLAPPPKAASRFRDAIHADGHGHKSLDAPRGRVPARRSLFEKRARHPSVSCFACDLTGTFLTADIVRNVSPNHIWLNLCGKGPRTFEAMNYCNWFLENYVENSERQTLSIKSENHSEQSVKRDLTVLHLWRTFVTAADNTILYPKSQIVTDCNPSLWTLVYIDGKARRGSGPVSDIVDHDAQKRVSAHLDSTLPFAVVEQSPIKRIWQPLRRIRSHVTDWKSWACG